MHPPTPILLPTPTFFPVENVNVYLLGPEPLTLVDCGPATEQAWTSLAAWLAAAGATIHDIERLVVTHPHADHAGLAGRVQKASGCTVYAHPLDHRRLLGAPEEWQQLAWFLVEICRRAGVATTSLAALQERLEVMPGYYTAPTSLAPLDEGCVLMQGKSPLQVLHTPGHARGSLCLWQPQQRLLLSGDTLLPHISANAILEPDDERFRQHSFLEQRATLQRLAALQPACVLPGHGEPMGDPRARIAARDRFHEERAEAVLQLVRDGARTPWEIASRLFPAMEPAYPYLGVSEVVGHLDLLAQRGQLLFEGQADPWIARPSTKPRARRNG